MKLIDLERLSQLIYKKNESELYLFMVQQDITIYRIFEVAGNDRAVIFYKDHKLYITTAGSDDKQDWKENFMVRKMKDLFYGFKGYAIPAKEIAINVRRFIHQKKLGELIEYIILIGHSRGDGVDENVFVQLKEYYSDATFKLRGWGFGGPGGGGRKFRRLAGDCDCDQYRYIHFEIKGDPVHWVNFMAKPIGRVVKLPRQIHGFFNRIKLLFKGKINHRSYSCVENIEPWKRMDDIGEDLE